jgi:hypothetical protein
MGTQPAPLSLHLSNRFIESRSGLHWPTHCSTSKLEHKNSGQNSNSLSRLSTVYPSTQLFTFLQRFDMYIASEHASAIPGHIPQNQHCSAAFPLQKFPLNANMQGGSTPAQDLVRRYRAGIPISPNELQQPLSVVSPLETLYNWEYEPLAINCPILNRVFSPSSEALLSSAVSCFCPFLQTLLIGCNSAKKPYK